MCLENADFSNLRYDDKITKADITLIYLLVVEDGEQ